MRTTLLFGCFVVLVGCSPTPPDTSSPGAPGLNGVTSPTIADSQSISGTKDGASHVYINGTKVTGDADFDGTEWSANVALIEGENPLFIEAKDEFLNVSAGVTASILRERPVIVAPVSGSTFGNMGDLDRSTTQLDIDVVVTFGTTDVAIADVVLLEASAPICGAATAAPGGAVFRCAFANGAHTLSARITDSAANEALADDQAFTANAVPLPISISGPDSTDQNTRDFTVDIPGGADGMVVEFTVNGMTTMTGTLSAGSVTFTNVPSNTAQNGNQTHYEARANDGLNDGVAFHATNFSS